MYFPGKITVALVVGALLFGCPAGECSAADSRYVWPLETSENISSGFCAYRDAHYHGGIDISTGGREGLPVRAADSGFVFRITTDYWGYGKALYVSLADGRTAVYGHLSRFNDAITGFVEQEQYALQRYKTNLFPRPDEIPVRRGEVIGYTGQTGFGPQHLHFEIRTAGNFPLNPLATGAGYIDQTAPEFKGILIRPLLSEDPASRVENGLRPRYYQTEKGSRPGRFIVRSPITVDGAIGLAVECQDPTGYKEYSIVPQGYMVTVNNLRFFELRYDSLDFALTRQIDLAYDFDWLADTGGRLQQLYRHPCNTLPWYKEELGDGVLRPGETGSPVIPGENRIVITAFDAAGNEATVEITLVFNKLPGLTDVRLEAVRGQWHISGRVADPDDYVSRLALRRVAAGDTTGKMAWVIKDSIVNEDFSYIAPGPFAGGELLQLTATDSWGASTSRLFNAPGGIKSELTPESHYASPLVGEFVPGGLILRPPNPDSPPASDLVVMEIQTKNPPADSWAFFLGVDDYRGSVGKSGAGRLQLSADLLGFLAQKGDTVEQDEGYIMDWPEDLYAVATTDASTIYSTDHNAWAKFHGNDVPDGGFFRIRPYNLSSGLAHRPSSMLYSFEPISVPFMQKVEVGISYAGLEGMVDDLALYALRNDHKSWKFLSRNVDPSAKCMTAEVWSFGAYALVADTLPPKISDAQPATNSRTASKHPEISCQIIDDLSGIGSDLDIKILLDGEWLIPEYDPETGYCKSHPRTDLKPGRHTLEILARDRVGREDRHSGSFDVVVQKK